MNLPRTAVFLGSSDVFREKNSSLTSVQGGTLVNRLFSKVPERDVLACHSFFTAPAVLSIPRIG